MPKIKQDLDEEESEDEDQFDEESEEELEQEPKKLIKRPIQASNPARVGNTKNIQQPASKRRYGVMAAQPVRIVDVESNEIVGEGEYLIAQVLADILERLERIENTIGSMTQ